MASTKADSAKTAVKYVTNEPSPRTFAIAGKTVYVIPSGALLGADLAEPGDLPIPNELKVRKVKVTDATGFSRWIPIYNVDGTLWTTPGTTITLDKNGVDTVFVSQTERRPERIGRKGKSVPYVAP